MKNFNLIEQGDVRIIGVEVSRATLEFAEEFKNLVADIIKNGNKKIIVDLSSVQFLDSTFLGSLVVNLKRVATGGGDLRLVACGHCEDTVVWSMFEATRMNKVFRVFEDLNTAVKSFE
ncbi:MAG: STAS domain-containing protein [Bacteroidetes bacterium]|nr:STAS domain-containing protein [Bacteroidota bacterium]